MPMHHHPIRITAGFIPLTDSLLLIVARDKGFAHDEGVELTLVRETSWANIRDRVAVGHFDVAHMLAPMPITASLGLTPIPLPVIAPMSLGLGGNAITVSRALWTEMRAAGAPLDFEPAAVGLALQRVVRSGRARLRFGVVHPHSSHNYELRYWLAASGIHPLRDVEMVVVAPPLMADALAVGALDGYCVGEPWNSVAVDSGAGRIATVKAALWPRSPEKVLGVGTAWAAAHPEALAALIRALHRAAQWCAEPANHPEAAELLARPQVLGQNPGLVARALSGEIAAEPGRVVTVADFFVPYAGGATLPRAAHALWFYSQIVRWGGVVHSADNAAIVRASVRPDLYRAALGGDGPGQEPGSAALRFFDGRDFDPDAIADYIAAQRAHDGAIGA